MLIRDVLLMVLSKLTLRDVQTLRCASWYLNDVGTEWLASHGIVDIDELTRQALRQVQTSAQLCRVWRGLVCRIKSCGSRIRDISGDPTVGGKRSHFEEETIEEARTELQDAICGAAQIEHADIRAINTLLYWGKGAFREHMVETIRGVARCAVKVAGISAHYELETLVAELQWPLLEKIKFAVTADWTDDERRRADINAVLWALVGHAPRLEVIRLVLNEWDCEVGLAEVPGFTCVHERCEERASKIPQVRVTWERAGRREV